MIASISGEEAGFRQGGSTNYRALTHFMLSRINCGEIQRERSANLNCFVEFRKTFDSMYQKRLWAVLRSFGTWRKLIRFCRASMWANKKWRVYKWRINNLSNRQGDLISPNVLSASLVQYWNMVKQEWLLITVCRVNNMKLICRRCGS